MQSGESNAQEENRSITGNSEEQEGSGQGFTDNSAEKGAQARQEIPDVTLDVPSPNIEEARLQVDNLNAKISLQAELSDMVRINVGVNTFLEKVELDLKGLEAQAMLTANLENVRDIIGRTLESLDNNPDLIDSLAQGGTGTGGELEGAAGTVKDAYEKPQDGNSVDPEEQETRQDPEADETQEPDEEDTGEKEIEATDAARSKAEDLGLDLAQVEGTGSGGRITVRDVQMAGR